jgi:TPR repeat protein
MWLAALLLARPCLAADADVDRLRAAAVRGNTSKEIELASAYLAGNGIAQDMKMSAYWFRTAAEQGDPVAQYALGTFYMTGTGVSADPALAAHWYQLSAASGLVQAKVNLGTLYYWGDGVTRDVELASQLFREAASRGNGEAATYLGNMYYFGHGVAQDRAAGEYWYSTGVKMHDPVATFNLGILFTGQNQHISDLPKAAQLLRRSADAGFVPALYSLGRLLARHPELARSGQESHLLFEGAASAGSWRASIALGVIARDGDSKAADPEAAYYHFQIAVLQGGETAKKLLAGDLRELSAKLSPEQMKTQASNASTWHKEHPFARSFVYMEGRKGLQLPAAPLAADDKPEQMNSPPTA